MLYLALRRLVLVAAILALILMPAAVFAQDGGFPVPPTDFRSLFVSVVSTIVLALLTFVFQRLHAWLGISIEANHRAALHSAIMSGVQAGWDRYLGTGLETPEVRTAVGTAAVDYVKRSVPDAIRFFGVSDEQLAVMARAKAVALDLGAPAR